MMDEWDMIDAVLAYDPETGVFTWKKSAGQRLAGSVAGSFNDQGYWRLKIKGKQYRANRLAYFMMMKQWPEHEVDHINGKRDDNRWCNLRHATRLENEVNKPHKGVRQMGRRFMARITVNGNRIDLGRFDTEAEAMAAYRGASRIAFGRFARQAPGVGPNFRP